MATAYVIWDRAAKTIVSSGGAPLVFNASADASLHITASLDAKRGGAPVRTYDVLTVQVS
jgi:hypothetical protein